MKFTLNVLTPLHIGAGQIGLSDFVFYGGYLYVVDEGRLGEVLQRLRLVSDFVSWCGAEQRPDIARFLSERKALRLEVLQKMSSRRIAVEGEFRGDRVLLHAVDPVTMKPAVPGSSVKGAIRTALISSLVKNDSRALSDIRQALQRRPKKETAGRFLDDLLRNGSLPGADRGPHNDWLRCLLVGDASPVKVSSSLIPVKVLSLAANGNALPKAFTIWVEAVLPGSSFEIDISVDERTFDLLRGDPPFKDLDHLTAVLADHARRLAKEDVSFFDKAGIRNMAEASKNLGNRANLRLGWGGGWLSTSVGSVLDERLRCDVRRAYYRSREGFPFPKHRRVWVDSQGRPKAPLGWVSLKAGGAGN